MTQGITLLAIGRKEYGYWARNMAASIRHYSGDVNIQLLHDGQATAGIDLYEQYNGMPLFTRIDVINAANIYDDGKLAPGKAKIYLYDYFAWDHSIYLDIDGCCIADITPMFAIAHQKPVVSQVWGYGGKHDKTYGDLMFWADADPIWKHFELPDDAMIPFLNTSFISVLKGKEAERIFRTAQHWINHPLPLSEMRELWGKGNQPDELYFNVSMAINNYQPHIDQFTPVYFRPYKMYGTPEPLANLQAKHYFIGLWGGRRFNHRSQEDYYDGVMRKVWAAVGQTNVHKSSNLMPRKFVETN